MEQELEAGADPATGIIPSQEDEPAADPALTDFVENFGREVDRDIVEAIIRDADTPGFKQELLFDE